MREVFEVEAASENGCTQLTLPAAPYAMLDALERLRLEPGETPRWELLKSYDAWHIYQYMDQEDGSLADLNALAQRLALLKDQEFAIIEGLAAMEPGPLGQSIPLSRLIDMAYSTDCCHLVEGVVTDAQLGRFCAESGFVPGADSLTGEMFELLDFERIGKQFGEAEGGVFTRGGYVQRREELKQVYKTLDFTPKKPDYTMLAELPDGSRIKLPTPPGKTMADEPAQCVDCATPSLTGLTAMLSTLDMLARRMVELEVDGELTKYKALLEAVHCQDMIQALTLADGLDQYTFSPKLLEPEDVAFECLRTMLPGNEVELLTPYLDLRRYAQAALDQTDGLLTRHGMIQRTADQPAQTMDRETESNELEMM